MKKLPRFVLLAALLLCAFLFLAVLAVRLWFQSYLKSSAFREKISAASSRALKADGELLPLHLSGTTIYSDGFVAHGSGAASFSELRADQLRADFNWRGLLHRAWQIDQVELQRLDIRIAERTPEPQPEGTAPARSEIVKPKSDGWKVDLRQADIRESRWSWGRDASAGGVTGTALRLTPEGESWVVRADGGKITQAGWPDLQIESARLRYLSPSLFVSSSTLRGGGGSVEVTGEINLEQGADLQVELHAVKVTPLLPADWRARLTGNLSSSAKMHAPLGGDTAAEGLTVEGSARLTDGQLTALPVLDQIATFTRSQRFRQMALNKASLDFTRGTTKFTARNVIAESDGLMRVEGSFTIEKGQIDGTFQVGVTPASLQWLPGSQARVFTVAHDGYLWTPMRLTGPVDHPVEDLTPRLAAAAANEVLKGVESTVRETAKGLLDLLPR